MRLRISLAAAALWWAAGAAAANEVIGTIEATIAGERSTWYLLQPPGEVPPTALWIPFGPDRGALSLSAYPSTDLTFVQDAGTGATVPAEGSAVLLVSVVFPIGADAHAQTLPLQAGEPPAAVVLIPNWRELAVQRNMGDDPGEIRVTRIEASQDGPSRFSGTFHGTMRDAEGAAMTVTDGRFAVDGARFFTGRQ
jgi:hypothetical protein